MAAESPRTGLTASITRVNFHPLMRPTTNPATKVVTDWKSNPILSPIPSLILETSLKNKLHCFKIKHYIVWSRKRSYLLWKCNAINLFLSEKVETLPTVQSYSHFLNTKWVIFFGNSALSGKKGQSLSCRQREGAARHAVEAVDTAGVSWYVIQPSECTERNCVFSSMGSSPRLGFSHPQSSRGLIKMLFWFPRDSPLSDAWEIQSLRLSRRKLENFIWQWNNSI